MPKDQIKSNSSRIRYKLFSSAILERLWEYAKNRWWACHM